MTIDHHTPDDLSDFAELLQHGQEASDPLVNKNSPVRRRRRRRALIVTAITIAVVLAVVGGYTGWALNAPVRAPHIAAQAPSVPISSAASVPLASDGASALRITGGDAYFSAAKTGIALRSGSDKPRPIASISKLITALVVLEARPLSGADDTGPTITFSKADHDLYDKYYVMGATIAAMPRGSSMSEYDALATMLIPSACNYAEAIATWAYGSQSAFLSATRRWLAAHGLTGTTIVEPTGISHRNTSTTKDLLKIGQLAAANPSIVKITGTSSLSLPGPGAMFNTNDLLGTDGISGLKTGNLGEGSFALLYTASLDVGVDKPLEIIGVVLGGDSRQGVDSSVLAALDGIRAGFHTVPLTTSGQQIGTYSTPWGATARMVVSSSASILTWSDTPITATMKTTTPKRYANGEVIGSITWHAGPSTATAQVTVAGSISPPTAWWRLTHPFELGGK